MRKKLLDSLRKVFRPEFINRLDGVIVFHPLNREHLRNIVNLELEKVAERMAEHNIQLHASDAALDDIKIFDKHKQVLLQAKKIRADVKSIDLKTRKLILNDIALTNADFNLIYYKADSSLNLQFIVDYFASPVVDTTYSNPGCSINNAKLIGSHFALRDERYMSPGKGIDFSDMDLSKLNLEVKDILSQGR